MWFLSFFFLNLSFSLQIAGMELRSLFWELIFSPWRVLKWIDCSRRDLRIMEGRRQLVEKVCENRSFFAIGLLFLLILSNLVLFFLGLCWDLFRDFLSFNLSDELLRVLILNIWSLDTVKGKKCVLFWAVAGMFFSSVNFRVSVEIYFIFLCVRWSGPGIGMLVDDCFSWLMALKRWKFLRFVTFLLEISFFCQEISIVGGEWILASTVAFLLRKIRYVFLHKLVVQYFLQ